MYYIYILECSDSSFYTGITLDIRKRIKEHYYRLPSAAKYTKSHPVIGLKALWTCDNKSLALKLEAKIKSLTKSDKIRLCKEKENILEFFPDLVDDSYQSDPSISFEDCI